MTFSAKGSGGGEQVKVVTARSAVELGAKLQSNMLEVVDWPADKVPADAATSLDQAAGKYCVAPISAGLPILASQLDTAPATLQPDPGYLAVAINTETESANLGKNLIPGNRVDVVWVMTKQNEAFGPFSTRLLENVRVLAVGQNANLAADTDSKRDLKSVTLEVKAKMDENLFLAQELGKLSLSMRNPNDRKSNEPAILTDIADLLARAQAAKNAEADSPALKEVGNLRTMFEGLTKRFEQFSQQPNNDNPALAAAPIPEIPAGMRAVTIQTPSESTGVAGLLLPGHRVDVIVSWKEEFFNRFNTMARERESRSVLLLENVEVLAVDTQLQVRDASSENKQMSRSVTLVVTPEMGRQVSQAQLIGTITLALRGQTDSSDKEPRQVRNLDQYLSSCLAALIPAQAVAKEAREMVVPIRVNRGGANSDQMFRIQGGPNEVGPGTE
jgi:pilus assembly protein CpaB